jgi:hypothetical protein
MASSSCQCFAAHAQGTHWATAPLGSSLMEILQHVVAAGWANWAEVPRAKGLRAPGLADRFGFVVAMLSARSCRSPSFVGDLERRLEGRPFYGRPRALVGSIPHRSCEGASGNRMSMERLTGRSPAVGSSIASGRVAAPRTPEKIQGVGVFPLDLRRGRSVSVRVRCGGDRCWTEQAGEKPTSGR